MIGDSELPLLETRTTDSAVNPEFQNSEDIQDGMALSELDEEFCLAGCL